jgi:phenylalanyl-tRNA synthetase beta chain
MKYSWNWLCDYVDLDGVTPETVAERFTMTVAELEGVEKIGEGLAEIVVGQIIKCEPHPDSVKLKIIEVDVGNRVVSGVSGAPNVRVGIFVPVALPGVILPGGFEVRAVEVRGIQSAMVALSERELGLSDDHSGLLELPAGVRAGARLTDVLPVEDTVFEVDNKSITHRPDLWGHHGVAREVAALTGRQLKPLDEKFVTGEADLMSVRVDQPTDCPRYLGMCFDGVTVAPSPFWIRARLRAVGHRPINNVVDLTNYVMLAVGEPMHAFDRRNIHGDSIIVRRAAEGEHFRTLDSQDHVLSSEDLLIADADRGVALAGVMGGENSEVLADTAKLFIECANFQPGRIRRTTVRHSIRTDSSTRFEKSLDPRAAAQAMSMFTKMVMELCPGAAPSSRAYDIASFSTAPLKIRLDPSFISRRLGRDVPYDRTIYILKRLGFDVELRPDGIFMVTVPSWRATKDVSIPEDLLEEVGRFVGYDNVPPVHPKAVVSLAPRHPQRAFIYRSKHILARDCGLDEIERYSFDSTDTLKKIGYQPADQVRLANPISADQLTLRTDLTPNMLNAMELNCKNFNEFQMFEIGRVFRSEPKEDGIPWQKYRIGILAYRRAARKTAQLEELFRYVKGVVERYTQMIGFQPVVMIDTVDGLETQLPWVHPGANAVVTVGGAKVGYITCVHPATMRGLDVLGGAVYVDLDLEALMAAPYRSRKFKSVPRFPSSQIDSSFIVPERTRAVTLEQAVWSGGGKFLTGVELIAVYAGKPIPDGHKSVTFRMTFQAPDRTLSDEEIKAAVDTVTGLARAAGATIWGEGGDSAPQVP